TLSYGVTFVQTDEAVSSGGQTSTTACTTFDKKDTYNVGDEIALCNNDTNKSEDFYVISDNGDTVTALAKYNLLVGNEVEIDNFDNVNVVRNDPIDPSTTGYGLQNSSARGIVFDNTVWTGTIAFAEDKNQGWGYWYDTTTSSLKLDYGTTYPVWVFDENSLLYEPIKNYESYIKTTLGKTSVNTSLLSYEQATALGCSHTGYSGTCEAAPNWVYSTTYWLGSAGDDYYVWRVGSDGNSDTDSFYIDIGLGLRPVVTISKTDL
ncbi:MAG: hypothetical protein ACI4U0_01195, partial [Candidatus Aphodocola sp.]